MPYLIILAIIVITACAGNPAQSEEPFNKHAYHGFHLEKTEVAMIQPEDFPIIPWGWSPGDKKALTEIKECGFNVAGFVAPQHVDLVEEVGLKCIVDDPRMSRAVYNLQITEEEIAELMETCVTPLKDHPAVFGHYLYDEPHSHMYPALAKWAEAVKKADPDALAYINLLPIGAQDGGVASYDEYVRKFIDTVKPTYVSYDHYTLYDDGSVRQSFFQNLEYMRKVSLEKGIPFWNIILSNGHFRYAEPSPGGLRMQAFSSLAYGVRGLSYFTYFAPLIGNYREAPIDQFMNKTQTWDWIRNINLQIHKLGPTYLTLNSVNVFHFPNVPPDSQGIETSKFVAEISGGGDFLVGEFEDPEGKPYIFIVNKDIHTSTHFGVRFKEEGRIILTNQYTGQKSPWAGENNWLAPGQGMMLSLEK